MHAYADTCTLSYGLLCCIELLHCVCRCGLTRESLGASIGIHPTSAEEITKLHITKSSGVDPEVTGC